MPTVAGAVTAEAADVAARVHEHVFMLLGEAFGDEVGGPAFHDATEVQHAFAQLDFSPADGDALLGAWNALRCIAAPGDLSKRPVVTRGPQGGENHGVEHAAGGLPRVDGHLDSFREPFIVDGFAVVQARQQAGLAEAGEALLLLFEGQAGGRKSPERCGRGVDEDIDIGVHRPEAVVKLHCGGFSLNAGHDTVAGVSVSISPEVAARPLFIINPMSGGGRTKQRIGAVVDAIERAGLVADLVFTTHRGHATELAREAIDAGREFLVGCGGDGTVYEVANGILGLDAGERVRLSTIGLGTGKDIAKCLGMGRGSLAIKAIAAGNERRIDVGKVTCIGEDGAEQVRYFLLEASAGWVPEISQGTPRWLKRLGDTAPYMVMAGVKMVGPMGRQFTLTIDGNTFDGRYNSVSVHNMELWGGDLVAAPGAAPDDGLLDVIRWGDLGRRMVVKVMDAQRKGGTHVDFDGVDRHPARTVEVSSPKRSVLDLDGEHGGFLPAKIEIVPRALRFVAPPIE